MEHACFDLDFQNSEKSVHGLFDANGVQFSAICQFLT